MQTSSSSAHLCTCHPAPSKAHAPAACRGSLAHPRPTAAAAHPQLAARRSGIQSLCPACSAAWVVPGNGKGVGWHATGQSDAHDVLYSAAWRSFQAKQCQPSTHQEGGVVGVELGHQLLGRWAGRQAGLSTEKAQTHATAPTRGKALPTLQEAARLLSVSCLAAGPLTLTSEGRLSTDFQVSAMDQNRRSGASKRPFCRECKGAGKQ